MDVEASHGTELATFVVAFSCNVSGSQHYKKNWACLSAAVWQFALFDFFRLCAGSVSRRRSFINVHIHCRCTVDRGLCLGSPLALRPAGHHSISGISTQCTADECRRSGSGRVGLVSLRVGVSVVHAR